MKKRTIKLFLFIMFIICVVCLYKVYINYKMIKEIIKQPPIVFSARFKDGDKGTFKYDIQTKKLKKFRIMLFKNYPIVMIMKSRDKNIKHLYITAVIIIIYLTNKKNVVE